MIFFVNHMSSCNIEHTKCIHDQKYIFEILYSSITSLPSSLIDMINEYYYSITLDVYVFRYGILYYYDSMIGLKYSN